MFALAVRPYRQCRAEIYLLIARERGRARPIRAGYRPQLFVGATDVTATLGIDPTGALPPAPRVRPSGVPIPLRSTSSCSPAVASR